MEAPCLGLEYNTEFELVLVEIQVTNRRLRVITGHGPQKTGKTVR